MAAEADTFTPLHFRELEKSKESQWLGRILERVLPLRESDKCKSVSKNVEIPTFITLFSMQKE